MKIEEDVQCECTIVRVRVKAVRLALDDDADVCRDVLIRPYQKKRKEKEKLIVGKQLQEQSSSISTATGARG